MPYTTHFNTNLKIVEAHLTGYITEDELQQETIACISLSKEHNSILFLTDAKEGIITTSLLKILEIEVTQTREKISKQSKIAVIEPLAEDSKLFAHYYETICNNQGWNAKVFQGRESAIEWLLR